MPEAQAELLTPDEVLIDLARSGEPGAREELFRRHFAIAYRVAYRLLGQEQDAQDAVQEGFLKALRHLDDFDGRSGFRTWLLASSPTRPSTPAANASDARRCGSTRPRAGGSRSPPTTTRPWDCTART